MGLITKWDDPHKTVLLTTIHEDYTVDDMVENAQIKYQMITSAGHPVFVITDLGSEAQLPANFIRGFRRIDSYVAPNERFNIIVSQGMFMKVLSTRVLSKVAPNAVKQFRFAATIDDARRMIQQEKARGTLPV